MIYTLSTYQAVNKSYLTWPFDSAPFFLYLPCQVVSSWSFLTSSFMLGSFTHFLALSLSLYLYLALLLVIVKVSLGAIFEFALLQRW